MCFYFGLKDACFWYKVWTLVFMTMSYINEGNPVLPYKLKHTMKYFIDNLLALGLSPSKEIISWPVDLYIKKINSKNHIPNGLIVFR